MRKPLKLLLLLFVLQYSIAQVEPSELTASLGAEFTERSIITKKSYSRLIPFNLNGGLIFFEAFLNGIPNTFVLDTGSPGLLLNEKEEQDSTSFKAVGVSGGVSFSKKDGQYLQMGNQHIENLESLCTDLSHLEKVKKQKFRGMVGQQMLLDYELLLNYQNKTIQLLDGGKKEAVQGLARKDQVPFECQQHFAVVEVKIGNHKYHFGIDTGAEVNLLDSKIANRLSRKKVYEKTDVIKIRGINKKGVGATKGIVSKMNIHGTKFKDMPFVVMDMAVLNAGKGIKLDGLLGYPFLSSGIFSIDYEDQCLNIWEKVGTLKEPIIVNNH